MRTPGSRDCGGCRYWSEMLAQAGSGTENSAGALEAMCLAEGGPKSGQYTTQETTCGAFAKNTLGAIDDPPDHGEEVRAGYAEQATAKHANGALMYAKDGTLLDEKGNRSIFDDLDE